MRLPPSPTPKNVAAAYSSELLEPAVTALAGKDGRLSKVEAARARELPAPSNVIAGELDAFFTRTGLGRPTVGRVLEEVRRDVVQQAAKAAGPDGRVSMADSKLLQPSLLRAFEVLRRGVSTDWVEAAKRSYTDLVRGDMRLVLDTPNLPAAQLPTAAAEAFATMRENEGDGYWKRATGISVEGRTFVALTNFLHDSFVVRLYSDRGQLIASGEGYGSGGQPVDWL